MGVLSSEAETEAGLRERFRVDLPYYACVNLKIVTKGDSYRVGGIANLVYNKAQRWLHGKIEEQKGRLGFVRLIGLKGRQQGFSTYVSSRGFHFVMHGSGRNAFVLSHATDTTKALFRMVRRFHENIHPSMRMETDVASVNELRFKGLDSGFSIGTAGTENVGRGHTIHFFHGSECALWPNAEGHMEGIMQAVPNIRGTEVILESTARGVGNLFHQFWEDAEKGKGLFVPVFIPWYWQDEYRMEPPLGWEAEVELREYGLEYGLDDSQMYWMEMKRAELVYPWKFRQEYPGCSSEAFQSGGQNSLIRVELVDASRVQKPGLVVGGARVLGVDVARSLDGDSSALCLRQGRRVERIEEFRSNDLTVVADRVSEWINKYRVDRAFVDMGMGAGVVDVLRRRGFGQVVTGVQFGGSATDKLKYRNKRAEMWFRMRDWFEDAPCEIPNEDRLIGELSGPQFNPGEEKSAKLESKDDMRRRGVGSPDMADALALTFAYHVAERGVGGVHGSQRVIREYDLFSWP